MNQKLTGIKCEHKNCQSLNATIIINRRVYCAHHAYYIQTGKLRHLEQIEKNVGLLPTSEGTELFSFKSNPNQVRSIYEDKLF